jgi:hypothetical protein
MVATLLACYTLGAILLWLPCRALARWLLGQAAPVALADQAGLVIVAAVGYLAFWIYLFQPRLGWMFSLLAITVGALATVLQYRGRWGAAADLISRPVRFAYLLGLLYLSLVSLHGGVEETPTWFVPSAKEDPAAGYFWLEPRSIDSLIPIKYACAVAEQSPLRGEINFGNWCFSDRPPLQSAVYLLGWPLTRLFAPGLLNLALGTWLQVQWAVSGAGLMTALGYRRRRVTFVLLCVASAGFVYFNSIYVWPKLLAATYVFTALAPLANACRQRRRLVCAEAIVAGAACAFAMLAHGSAAFSLLPAAIIAMGARRFWDWRSLLQGGLAASAIYVPWLGYQKFVDPPGNRCQRWMLAGESDVDDRSSWQCIRDAYGQQTRAELFSRREENLVLLFRDPYLDQDIYECARGMLFPAGANGHRDPAFIDRYYLKASQLACDWRTLFALLRYDQVEETFRALGVLNVAWPILLWSVFRTRGRCLLRREMRLLLLSTGLSLLVWWLLIFGEGALIIRNSSYGVMLSLLALAAAIIGEMPAGPRWAVFALHLVMEFALWVVGVPTAFAVEFLHLTAGSCAAPLLGLGLAVMGIIATARTGCNYGPAPKSPIALPTGRYYFTHAAGLFAAVYLVVLAAASSVAISKHKLPPDALGRGNYHTREGLFVHCDGIWHDDRVWDDVSRGPGEVARIPLNGVSGLLRLFWGHDLAPFVGQQRHRPRKLALLGRLAG